MRLICRSHLLAVPAAATLLVFGCAPDSNSSAKTSSMAPEKMVAATAPGPMPDDAKTVDGRPVGDGWISLFNGKDMAGWKSQADYWKVEDGIMHGSTPGGKEHHYTYTEKADFDDFEIHADVKMTGYNSGVCIRIAPTSFDNVPGYQVDMGDGYWGCLWDERGQGMVGKCPNDMADKIVHKDDWNHYFAIAQGHHIQIWLNGVKTVDLVNEKGRLTGPIGFQLCHEKPTEAWFRNIYVKKLPKQEDAPQAAMPLPRSSPEAEGVSSKAVQGFIETLDQKVNTLHSVMVLRHGKVVAEAWWKPEAADKPHVLWSLSKSFNSTAVGLAIDEGKLSLDDHVLKFFPDEAPAEPSDNLKAMTVRDLLTMTCGHDTEPKIAGAGPTVKQFLAHPVVHKPGTHFQYNTFGSYVLSAIVTKVTGQTELDYLKPRLFAPLGIQNPQWDASPEGNSLGGYGLKLCTEDIAKFGQLYLQNGKWNGKQLIPGKWVQQATSKQVPNDQESHAKMGSDWQQGYGYQFWQCTHGAVRGDGAAGQFCVIIPDKDMVIAITANTGNMQGELNAIWEKLLPALQDAALPEDATAQASLKEAEGKLSAHPEKKAN